MQLYRNDNIMKKNIFLVLFFSIFFIQNIPGIPKIFSQDSTASQQIDPQNVEYYLNWGKQLTTAGKLDSAEKILKKAIRKNKKIAEIYFALGYVYYSKGKYRLIPFEKLLELLKVDNYSTAIKNFKKALTLKPDYWEAMYFLGRTYLAQNSSKSLVKAEQEFQKVMNYDRHYKDVVYQLAQVYKNQKELDKAIYLFQQIIAEEEKNGKAQVILAEVYFEKGMNRQACYFYNLGMDNLNDEDLLETFYDQLNFLMTDQEKSEYKNAPLARKGFIFKKFWTIRDPSPGSVENERLIEHYRRIRFVREHFHFTAPPYYDDRGRIYIKLGEPDYRYVAPVTEFAFYGSESWSYENIYKGLVFDFVENGGVYRLVEDLREAAGPAAGATNRLAVAEALYEQRSHISNSYTKLSTNFDETRLNEYIISRNQAIIATPPEVYRHPVEVKPLPLVYRMAQFRGEYRKTNLEIYFGISGNSLSFKKNDEKVYYADLEYSVVAIDSLFNDAVNIREQTKLETKEFSSKKSKNFVLREVAKLEQGDYWINLLVKAPDSKSSALIKKNIAVRDFSGSNLNLSDIQLSLQIKPAEATSSPQYVKHDLNIVPYPFFSIYRGTAIFIYYEIYNLKYKEQAEVDYNIEYKIETLKPEESFWSKFGNIFSSSKHPIISLTEERKGDSSTAIEYIAFDLNKLSYGLNKLTVIVTDKLSAEQVSSSIEFDLIK